MPSRNTIRLDIPEAYYHVYARGNSRQKLFLDTHDYQYFINLFERYLSKTARQDRTGLIYPHFYGKLELLCYCLMENHFHLLVYQRDEKALTDFMRGLMASYSRYFNKKYSRSGSPYESRFKASHIDNQTYLTHISRYIHLNRKDWRDTRHTSIHSYLDGEEDEWLRPERILELFDSKEEYSQFVSDYEANQHMLDELKYELANNITP